jgi:hypothetical protein
MSVCTPYPKPRQVLWTEKKNPKTILLEIAENLAASEGPVRRSMDLKVKDTLDEIGKMAGLKPEEVVEKLVKNNFIGLDTVVDGQKLRVTSAKMPEMVLQEQVGPVLAAVKTAYQAQAGWIRNLAENFINRVDAGESALDAGLRFAKGVNDLNVMGKTIFDYDRVTGQNLLAQKLQNAGGVAEILGKQGLDHKAKVETIRQTSENVLTRVAKGFNSGTQEGIDDALATLEGLARLHKLANTPEQIAKMDNTFAMAGDMAWTMAQNGLLSGPATQSVNLASSINAIARPFMQLVPAAIASQFGGGARGSKMATAQAMAQISGMHGSFHDALKMAWKVLKEGRGIYGDFADLKATDAAFQGGWSAANFQQMAASASRGAYIMPDEHAQVFNWLGYAMTMPSKMLLAGDTFAKHMVLRGEVRAEGVRRAMLSGIDINDKAAMRQAFEAEKALAFKYDETSLGTEWELDKSYEWYSRIKQKADYATFQEANAPADAILSFLDSNQAVGLVARPFLPFVRTTLNILKQGFLDTTGIGLLMKTGKLPMSDGTWSIFKTQDEILKNFEGDPAEFYRMMGTAAFGMTLYASAFSMAASGQIVGGGPLRWSTQTNKKDMQEPWLRSKQAQGFSGTYQVKVGDTVIPFARFGEPFSTFLKMVVDIGEYSGYMTATEQDETATAWVSLVTRAMSNSTFLTGVDNFLTLVMDDRDPGQTKAVKAVQDWSGVYAPMGGLLNYVDQVQNPYQANYRVEGEGFVTDLESFWNVVTARYRSRMPGEDGGLPNMYDPVYGLPVNTQSGVGSMNAPDPFSLAVPFLPRGVKEADDLYEGIFKVMGQYRQWRPTDIPLTLAETQKMNQLAASFRINGKTKAEAMREVINTPEAQEVMKSSYGSRPGIENPVRERLREIEREYGMGILDTIAANDPNLAARKEIQKKLRAAKKAGDGEGQVAAKTQLKQLMQLSWRTERGLSNAPTVPSIPAGL